MEQDIAFPSGFNKPFLPTLLPHWFPATSLFSCHLWDQCEIDACSLYTVRASVRNGFPCTKLFQLQKVQLTCTLTGTKIQSRVCVGKLWCWGNHGWLLWEKMLRWTIYSHSRDRVVLISKICRRFPSIAAAHPRKHNKERDCRSSEHTLFMQKVPASVSGIFSSDWKISFLKPWNIIPELDGPIIWCSRSQFHIIMFFLGFVLLMLDLELPSSVL